MHPKIIQETATLKGIPQFVRHNGSDRHTERDEERQTHSPTMTLMSRTRQLPTTPITISSPNTVTNTHLSTTVQGRSAALSLRDLFTERDESESGSGVWPFQSTLGGVHQSVMILLTFLLGVKQRSCETPIVIVGFPIIIML